MEGECPVNVVVSIHYLPNSSGEGEIDEWSWDGFTSDQMSTSETATSDDEEHSRELASLMEEEPLSSAGDALAPQWVGHRRSGSSSRPVLLLTRPVDEPGRLSEGSSAWKRPVIDRRKQSDTSCLFVPFSYVPSELSDDEGETRVPLETEKESIWMSVPVGKRVDTRATCSSSNQASQVGRKTHLAASQQIATPHEWTLASRTSDNRQRRNLIRRSSADSCNPFKDSEAESHTTRPRGRAIDKNERQAFEGALRSAQSHSHIASEQKVQKIIFMSAESEPPLHNPNSRQKRRMGKGKAGFLHSLKHNLLPLHTKTMPQYASATELAPRKVSDTSLENNPTEPVVSFCELCKVIFSSSYRKVSSL